MESEPCEEQRHLMESLGWTSAPTTNLDYAIWTLSLRYDDDPLVWHNLELELDAQEKPTLPEVNVLIAQHAFRAGQRQRSYAIKCLLGH